MLGVFKISGKAEVEVIFKGNILGKNGKPTTLNDPYVLEMVTPSLNQTITLEEYWIFRAC